MTTKNQYERWLNTYIERRKALRLKYPGWNNRHLQDEASKKRRSQYARKVRRLTQRISALKWLIRKASERQEQLWQVAATVCMFFDIETLRHVGNTCKPELVQAKKLFCKAAIEQGINGARLAEFLLLHPDTPAAIRRDFTASFTQRPENRELWHRYQLFSKDYEGLKYLFPYTHRKTA
jgi:hypothetical protein